MLVLVVGCCWLVVSVLVLRDESVLVLLGDVLEVLPVAATEPLAEPVAPSVPVADVVSVLLCVLDGC
jgi:hypothetical protein